MLVGDHAKDRVELGECERLLAVGIVCVPLRLRVDSHTDLLAEALALRVGQRQFEERGRERQRQFEERRRERANRTPWGNLNPL